MKKCILVAFLCAMAYAQFLDDKFVVLPKFEPKSQMTADVKHFVEKAKQQRAFVRKANVKRDLLGRKTGDSTSYLVDYAKDERMKVVISYMNVPEPFLGKVYGRYESGASVNERRYWLNEIEIDESLYLKKYNEEYKKIRQNTSLYRKPYVAELSADEIKKIFDGPEIVYISKYMNPRPASNDTTVGDRVYYRDSIIRVQSQIETWAFGNGYRGDSIGVYFTETGCPNLDYVETSHYIQGNSCSHGVRTHPTGVTRVLQTTAPEAIIYGFDQDIYPLNPLEYPIPIYIGSHSWSLVFASNPDLDSLYLEDDKEMDNYIFNYGIIEFVSAGNRSSTTDSRYVTSPGKAVNAITVGAVRPDTYTYTSYTRWKNSDVKNHKPEVPNFAHFYFMGDTSFSVWEDGEYLTYNGTFGGTSASTPYTAAMAADVLSQHPFFKTHPEMFKSLMMTGSTVPVESSTLFDVDNYIRIKNIPQYYKMGWNTRSAYWNGNNSDFFGVDSSIVFSESGIVQGRRYRIAVSWLSSGNYVFQNRMLPQDIDLFVYQSGNLVKSSTSSTNPFELVDFVAPASGSITVRIKRVRNSQSDRVLLGYNFLNLY